MRVAIASTVKALRARLRSEDGFTVMLALGVLVVTSLLAAGAYAAVQADAPLAQRDLSGKRSYYAARAGLNAFTYELSQNPNLWQTCPTSPKDTSGNLIKTKIAPTSGQTSSGTTLPGAAEYYTYKPVPANTTGPSPANPTAICDPTDRPNGTHGDPIKTFIDTTSNTFQMQFTGYAGAPEVSRGIIATFKKATPLDYLWFTIYETLDPATYPSYDPTKPTVFPQTCNKWEREGRDSKCKDIQWVTGDALKGPAYTADQYLITGTPSFGRANKSDRIESSNPNDPTIDDSICFNNNCGASTNFTTTTKKAPNAEAISPPSTNLKLLDDAKLYGGGASGPADGPPGVQTGVTFITLSDTPSQATIKNCLTATCTTTVVPIGPYPTATPIIYVRNNTTGCNSSYTPYYVVYPTFGNCGTVYVRGSYSKSLTIAAQSDIILDGNITKVGNAPAPTLGLVANNFVRVMHGIATEPTTPGGRPTPPVPDSNGNFDCGSDTMVDGPLPNGEGDQTLTNLRVDAALLAIQHSFIVDNYDCGTHSSVADLHITGAIAQNFRGTVGTGGGSGASTGYIKDYNYDDRFTVAQPPYLFDIFTSTWHIARETLCVPSSTVAGTGCDAPSS